MPPQARACSEGVGAFHERYHFISCLSSDEAITGLRKSQYGIKGPLLPRIKLPGEGEYGAGGRAVNPEAFESEARFGVGPVSGLLLLPLRLVFDWVLRPVYNEVFAVLVNQYVLGRFTASDGADLLGLRARVRLLDTRPPPPRDARGLPRSGYVRDWFLRRFTTAALQRGGGPTGR